ncbi:RAMP superfamily CRISPR-associated protein [Shouchella lehensis]|uniref:CRISPR type III-associated protein domain-containing protein n=1 Tax=Shouchella lehensis TaxID=300825 RepID=A0A4Y7WMC4_9BACI|nr:RAMP superfamily CRISPR-associated protein [Shouchella lehensis]MBG9782992.1 hypothetical protein [Shouchella lehensis]TES49650.1 hypothetical protein E2L03_09325 [Shouchella lehensis]
MTNHITERTYFLLKGKLASPLLSGSGETEETENDIVVDQFQQPFVPGSSLAGAFRHYIGNRFPDTKDIPKTGKLDESVSDLEKLFGGNERQSRLTIHAMMIEHEKLTIRNGVKLDENKTAIEGALYDYQVIESGASWTIRLEWIVRAQDKEAETTKGREILNALLIGINEGEVTIGAKTNRGFGKLQLDTVYHRTFDYRNKLEVLNWLKWDWSKEVDTKNSLMKEYPLTGIELTQLKPIQEYCLRVPLKLETTLMIRSYSSEKKNKEDEKESDYASLQSNGQPVIPGTTWTGAIRARLNTIIKTILKNDRESILLNELFGSDSEKRASRIRVEESTLEGSRSLLITRNAIDRFTGGTVEGALYTGEQAVGGTTELIIRWSEQKDSVLSKDEICGMLLWVIKDLQNGLLAVGGETSVGRGVFCAIESQSITLNGENIAGEQSFFKAAINKVKEREKDAN